jgi:RNA polymerase sigma factor (sigma-70 family)
VSAEVRPINPRVPPATADPGLSEAARQLESAVRDHEAAVFAVCLAHMRDRHEAEDRTQEVFLKALTKIDAVREPASVRPWLLQIALRVCIDRARRRRPEPQPLGDLPAPPETAAEEPGWLLSALESLPVEEREILALYYLDGRSCPSIALGLGLSPAAVRQRLVRARLRLHDILVEDQK